jgi:hypothetical protein
VGSLANAAAHDGLAGITDGDLVHFSVQFREADTGRDFGGCGVLVRP